VGVDRWGPLPIKKKIHIFSEAVLPIGLCHTPQSLCSTGGALSQLRKNPYFFRGSFADWALPHSVKPLQNPVPPNGDCHNKHPSSICSIALIYLCPAVARTSPLSS